MKYEHVLYVIIITLIFMNAVSGIISVVEKSSYVHNTKCNKPLGEFSVESGLSSTEISKDCDGKACTFSNINSLYDAINKCNVMSKVCDRFIYNNKKSTMSIIKLKSGLSNDKNSDLYTRQVGVTYKNG